MLGVGTWLFVTIQGHAGIFNFLMAVPLIEGGAVLAALPVLAKRKTAARTLVLAAWFVLGIALVFPVVILVLFSSW